MPIARLRSRRQACAFLALTVLTTFALSRLKADEPDGSAAASDDRRLLERWRREIAQYTLVAHTDPERDLRLRDEPALHWTNPERTTGNGLVYLWLDRGRPAAATCMYRVRWEGRMVEAHEFVSLASVGLTATLNGRQVWSPSGPGVESRPVPGAPKPAKTAAERLRQLRTLARDFRTTVDPDMSPTVLRQLPQPIYRFETGTDHSPDGALFAFVLTTDPEAFLLLDERPGPDGPAWHYGFARMSDHPLNGRHGNTVVWEVPRDRDTNPSKPYCVRWDIGPR